MVYASLVDIKADNVKMKENETKLMIQANLANSSSSSKTRIAEIENGIIPNIQNNSTLSAAYPPCALANVIRNRIPIIIVADASNFASFNTTKTSFY